MSGEMLLFPRRRNPVSWQLSLGPRVRGDDATVHCLNVQHRQCAFTWVPACAGTMPLVHCSNVQHRQ